MRKEFEKTQLSRRLRSVKHRTLEVFALTQNISHYTTMPAAIAAVRSIEASKSGDNIRGLDVIPLQDYFSNIF